MQARRYIPENFIDDSLVKCFSPILTTQVILGASRISIKKQLVKLPNVFEKIHTFFCIVAVCFSFCYFCYYYYRTYHDTDTAWFVVCVTGMSVQQLSYLANIINARYCNSELAVKLYIKLQTVDSILSLKEFQNLKTIHYYWNIICLLIIIISFGCGFMIHMIATIEYPILTVFLAIGLLNVYLELLLAASLICYLAMRLRFLNKIVQYNILVKYGPSQGQHGSVVVNERLIIAANSNDSSSNNLQLDKFLICLKEILKLYKLITEVFSFPVLNMATTLFFWGLLIIQALVIGVRAELVSVIFFLTITLWVLFFFLLLTTLAFASDYFINQVKHTKLHCLNVLSYYFEGPLWKGAKEILRTTQYYETNFSVYGIFVLDKKLPLTLIGIITTNVVILLQFTMNM